MNDKEDPIEQLIDLVMQPRLSVIAKNAGLNDDKIIYLSEIEGILRKMALEGTPHGKRSLTETSEKPTEGLEKSRSLKPAQKIFEELQKKKQGI